MSKRLIKQATAAALLTTSVLSFSTVANGASTSVDQQVNKVKSELNKATTHYVYRSLDGNLAPSSSLYPALNSAKKNYQLTRKAVASSKLSSSQKNKNLKEIDTLYNQKISGGLVPYIDAYNYATKYLVPIMNEIEAAESRNDLAAVEKAYHKLSVQLKSRTAILYRFSGKAARDLILAEYKKPADAKRNELMVPVTIYMKTVEIKSLIAENKMDEAKKEFAEIEALLDRLPSASTNKLVATLLEEVAEVKAAIDGTLTQQQVFDTKIAALVTALNANLAESVTAATTGSNSLTVSVKQDLPLMDVPGKGFFPTFNTLLGVTKINGYNPTSIEAVAFLLSEFGGADSLVDLKGKTVVLPLTVNNGSAFDVNFSITFE
ncbi:hypothetical protein WAX74_03890 [Psychrobacillus sp. FJAT-51614]|uniref:SbsC C-terminal domain-containing protein n=1 Tax=Psychrobacillus mangrovi TaxID=3117745 RepID=A0ABU8F1D2_9BACI